MEIKHLIEKHKHNDKLCIIGTANSWDKAPYNDESFDFWGLNGLHGFTDQAGLSPRFTMWFQIHKKDRVWEQPHHLSWLKNCPLPIIMQDHYKEIPTSIRYPKEEIQEKYRPYFESSFAWMFTLAMEMGYKEIQVFGVHVSAESEYVLQRPNVEYLLGLAEGKGIKIYVPPEADILQSRIIYGYQDKKGVLEKIDHEIEQLEKRKNEIAQKKQQLALFEAKLEGALERDKYYRRIL